MWGYGSQQETGWWSTPRREWVLIPSEGVSVTGGLVHWPGNALGSPARAVWCGKGEGSLGLHAETATSLTWHHWKNPINSPLNSNLQAPSVQKDMGERNLSCTSLASFWIFNSKPSGLRFLKCHSPGPGYPQHATQGALWFYITPVSHAPESMVARSWQISFGHN